MAVLITGGSKGVGFAIAKRFAEPGRDILINYLRDEDSANAAVEALRALGARSHAIRRDVGSIEGARELMAIASEMVDRLDVIVHCAVRVLVGPLLEADPVALTQAIVLNGISLVYLVQAAGPLLKPGGSVVFLSSRGSRQVVPGYGAIEGGKGAGRGVRALSDAGTRRARRSHQLRRAGHVGYAGGSRPVWIGHGRVPAAGGRQQSERPQHHSRPTTPAWSSFWRARKPR